MKAMILNKIDISELEAEVIDENGMIKIVDSHVYEQVPHDWIMTLCLEHGLYQLPTTELLNWLSENIDPESTIEICAGNGVLAKRLGILATDNKSQDDPDVIKYYESIQQPTIKYGDDIIKMSANRSVEFYQPYTVIGQWVTQRYNAYTEYGSYYGPDEHHIVNNCGCYLHVGNDIVHGKKDISIIEHKEYRFKWLHSRAFNPVKNSIRVWGDL